VHRLAPLARVHAQLFRQQYSAQFECPHGFGRSRPLCEQSHWALITALPMRLENYEIARRATPTRAAASTTAGEALEQPMQSRSSATFGFGCTCEAAARDQTARDDQHHRVDPNQEQRCHCGGKDEQRPSFYEPPS